LRRHDIFVVIRVTLLCVSVDLLLGRVKGFVGDAIKCYCSCSSSLSLARLVFFAFFFLDLS